MRDHDSVSVDYPAVSAVADFNRARDDAQCFKPYRRGEYSRRFPFSVLYRVRDDEYPSSGGFGDKGFTDEFIFSLVHDRLEIIAVLDAGCSSERRMILPVGSYVHEIIEIMVHGVTFVGEPFFYDFYIAFGEYFVFRQRFYLV